MAEFEKWQKFVTPIGLLYFHDLFVARAWPPKAGEAPRPAKFSATLLVEPATFSEEDRKLWAALLGYAGLAGETMFPSKKDANGNPIKGTSFADKARMKDLKWPFKDALEKAERPLFTEGKIFFAATANADRHLDLVGPKKEILEERDVVRGCYGRLVVGPYAYDQGGGRGVTLGLYGFQKIRNGESLGSGGASCADMFAEEESEDFIGSTSDPLGLGI